MYEIHGLGTTLTRWKQRERQKFGVVLTTLAGHGLCWFFGGTKQGFEIAGVKFTDGLLKNSGRGKSCYFTSKFSKSVTTTLKIKILNSREGLSSIISVSPNRYSNHGGPCQKDTASPFWVVNVWNSSSRNNFNSMEAVQKTKVWRRFNHACRPWIALIFLVDHTRFCYVWVVNLWNLSSPNYFNWMEATQKTNIMISPSLSGDARCAGMD